MDGFWGTGWFWFGAFVVALLVNGRAAFKLFVDWKGMLTTCRFVEDAYAGLDALPDEAALERAPGAPVFLHLVPAWEEPAIAGTLAALLASRYPHGRLHVVLATKASEEAAPHPAMTASTAELAQRFRAGLPSWQQKMLSVVAMPGAGRKAHQLNWELRPETLGVTLGEGYDPRRVYVGVSDADSLPDRNVYRWIAAQALAGRAAPAYQGVTLSLANFAAHDARGRVCAIQQSSIFIRVSIARLINEARRVRWFAALAARSPRLARAIRPVFDFCFRRSQICLGHNQFVRLDVLQALGGFPTAGATEDSTLGYALGARGLLMAPLPLLELVARGAERVQRRAALPARRQQGAGVADRRRGLSRPRLPRLAPRVPLCRAPGAVRARHRLPVDLARAHHLGGRHRDAGPDREPRSVFPARRRRAAHDARPEVRRHVSLPDLLAARHAGRLAGALGAGDHWTLRPRQDRPRHPLTAAGGVKNFPYCAGEGSASILSST